jgi:hypothetical protein
MVVSFEKHYGATRSSPIGALEAERIAGVGVAIEARLFQRGQYQASIFVLEREALQRTQVNRQSYKLGDAV